MYRSYNSLMVDDRDFEDGRLWIKTAVIGL
jgi:hypothetical protein